MVGCGGFYQETKSLDKLVIQEYETLWNKLFLLLKFTIKGYYLMCIYIFLTGNFNCHGHWPWQLKWPSHLSSKALPNHLLFHNQGMEGQARLNEIKIIPAEHVNPHYIFLFLLIWTLFTFRGVSKELDSGKSTCRKLQSGRGIGKSASRRNLES